MSARCGTGTSPYPTGHMRWGLAGTVHAVSMLNVDSDGFATFVLVVCGKKLWVVYRPDPSLPLCSTDVFLSPDKFQLDRIPLNSAFGLEGLVLRPGDFLYFVYGLENAITYGGHFYCSSLMQATTESLVHMFILSDFILNTNHHPSWQLLR